MQDNEFYQKYANIPINKRFRVLSFDTLSILHGKTLNDIYMIIKDIDDSIRPGLIRKEKFIKAVEKFLT